MPQSYTDGMASPILTTLVAERHRAGITQVELARRLGVTQAVVARLESGQQDPKISTLERYARAIGATIQVMSSATQVEDSSPQRPRLADLTLEMRTR